MLKLTSQFSKFALYEINCKNLWYLHVSIAKLKENNLNDSYNNSNKKKDPYKNLVKEVNYINNENYRTPMKETKDKRQDGNPFHFID